MWFGGSDRGKRPDDGKMLGKQHPAPIGGKAEFCVWEHNERKVGGIRGL